MLSELQHYKTLDRYLSRSLRQRVNSESWFENRVIRYVLRKSSWVEELEATFQAADLGAVPNSGEIFRVLNGSEQKYDEKLFDALAEVRLASWARGQGYSAIEKLRAGKGHKTPDFSMVKDGRVFLAESKHFQGRDWLVEFVADRLEGLALKTGTLNRSGLRVERGSKYSHQRVDILARDKCWRPKVREQLTEAKFLSYLQSLPISEDAQKEIMDGPLDGLIVLRHSETLGPGRVLPDLGMPDSKEATRLRLSNFKSALHKALTQIKGYMDATGAHPDQALVFFSGIDEWQPEWSGVWEALDAKDEVAWKHLSGIRSAAEQLIGIPFELIVRRYQLEGRGPNGCNRYNLEYVPFPWKSKHQ